MTLNANKNYHDVKRETTEEKKNSFVELFFLVLTNESYIFIYIGFAPDLLNIGDSHGFTLSCFSIQSHLRSKF